MVQRIKDHKLQEAFEHYCRQSGHDTFALTAAQCISLVIENRRAVQEGEEAR